MEEFDFVCISLENRSDRRDRSRELFKRLGILDRIQWWIVKKHPQGGMYGCFESHWSIWTSSQFKRPYLCIFEDDLCETSDSAQRFHQSLNYARKAVPSEVEVLNLEPSLGFVNKLIARPSSSLDVYEGGFLHLGCYITHRSVLPKIAQKTIGWFGMDIDTALYKNCRMGGIFPKIFAQYEGDSDNGGGYRNIKPAFNIWNSVSTVNERLPMIGWFGIEMAQLLSLYYIMTRDQSLEFADRRIKKK